MIKKRLRSIGMEVFEIHYDEWMSDTIYKTLEEYGKTTKNGSYKKDALNSRVSNARTLFKLGLNEEALTIAKSRKR